jgi:deazaflavin-dependent oxidoreductase (nitroreductase family)
MAGETTIGDELASWGKVAMLETRGRTTGRLTRTPVGFVGESEGVLLVAAASERTDWVRNVLADPRCRATVGERTANYVAEQLDEGAVRTATLTELILKYGTPAERLGHGPVFRLRPIG